MPLDPALLEILVCPETHQPLCEVDADSLASLNQRVQEGSLITTGGKVVTEPLEGALVRSDSALAYPIRSGIPILLIDEAIQLIS